ncbi:uncharacterized protein LOC129592704 [Paramacrobiotus metropolitanus]|uniref:uncharacterized protein LOC129592704 n=1 Tax=Paramacrobiotus metropolitanus TaxID=2943436 RepID=UPI002445A0B5|nr:uncharacterized protein LOC129592704 [Paramacrobiotus metropolitanus]
MLAGISSCIPINVFIRGRVTTEFFMIPSTILQLMAASRSNNYAEAIFCVPLLLLRACGFLPIRSVSRNIIYRALDIFLRIVAAVICAGSWFFEVATIDSSLPEFHRVNKSLFPTNNPVIKVLMIATACVISLRAPLVLTVVLLKRSAWNELFHRLNTAVKLYVELHGIPKRKILRIRFTTVTLVVIFAALLATWLYVHINGALMTQGKTSLQEFRFVGSLGSRVSYWQLSIIWIFCGILPFLLTQLVFTIVIIAAIIQDNMLKNISAAFENGVAMVQTVIENEDALTVDGNIFKGIDEDLSRARRLYNANLQFCHYFNKHFSTVLLFIYAVDCFSVCGNVGMLVAGFSHSEAQLGTAAARWSIAYGICMFLFEIVFCFIPMAYVYEKSLVIAHNYEDMINLMEVLEQEHAEYFRSEILSQSRCTQPVFRREIFYGVGHLFHISGKFIVTTLTFVISFVVLAFEIIDLSELKDRVTEVKMLLLNHTDSHKIC